MEQQLDLVIFGAGLTGLASAYYAKKRGLSFAVIEKDVRTGGSIRSISKGGFQYEAGPNTGIVSNMETQELLGELQGCQPIYACQEAERRLVYKKNKWHALPQNLMQGAKTPLFTVYDKLRILGEPFRKPGRDETESLASLAARRLGVSFLDYAVDPFILGIYAGDPSMLSAKYAMPKLYRLEQQYGSFIKGSIAIARSGQPKASKKLFSFKGGMQSLTDALAAAAGAGNIFMAHQAELIKTADGFAAKSASGTVFNARRAIVAAPSHNFREIMPGLPEPIMAGLTNLQYSKVVQVAAGYKSWQGMDIKAFGGLVPHRENKDVLGALFVSSFLPGRAPSGGACISFFMGGWRRPDVYNWAQGKIEDSAASAAADMLGQRQSADSLEIFRYDKAIPQYEFNTKHRLAARAAAETKWPGLLLGGNAFDGVGAADRIAQAKQMVERL
jgi:protoporphyrinogen/coproporphyrinogen III oxidase